MKTTVKTLLFALGCVVVLYSSVNYLVLLKVNLGLQKTIYQIKEQLGNLENEKQKLLQELEKEKNSLAKLLAENTQLKNNLKTEEQKDSKLNQDLAKSQEESKQVIGLKQERDELVKRVEKLTQENEGLNSRLRSLGEQKKAIKELQTQIRKVGIEVIKKTDSKNTAIGNRGFLLNKGATEKPQNSTNAQ
ncbi:MAG: hypothetical protein PHY94_06880 [Candidatus Omnitrophica bacterium]|nr:hypothetical protein [Candidatus Omnitrophota bacterium]